MITRLFLIVFLTPLVFMHSALAIESNALTSSCEEGRWIQPSYPICSDLENPNPLTKSCRDADHGLDAQPASITQLRVVSDWEIGGSGTYDELCRKKMNLGPLQTATFLQKTAEDDKKSWGVAKYKYECLYSIRTDQYADKVSEACVSPEELYPQVSGPQCLSQTQSDQVDAVATQGYSSEALSAYTTSLGSDLKWTESASAATKAAQPIALCSNCSDIPKDLPLTEMYNLQVECLSSLITFNPTLDSMNVSEIEALKSIGKKLDRGLTLNQVEIEEDKQGFVEAVISFLDDL